MQATTSTIVICVTVISVCVFGFITGIAITGNLNSDTTPIITTVLGGVATTIAALIALIKADNANASVKELDTKVQNGLKDVAVQAAQNVADHEPMDNPSHVQRLKEVIHETLAEHKEV